MTTAVDTTRPSRADIERATPDLVRRHGVQIMATARYYSQSPEDAEDAYQRGLEILLTKAPTTDEAALVPWLKTVVKHEAFAVRKQRERSGTPAAADHTAPANVDTHEHVERIDKLQRGAEALGRLKAHEMRCILLLAEGHSYAEICALTGFSYTKVNRCLTEGRRSFLERVERIESGAECERLAPLISAVADGEASARDMAMIRPHLRTCLTCRAALRDAREVPARVAALAPVGVIAASGHGGAASLLGALRSAAGWLNERVTSLAMRGQDVVEAASAHKLAAAAASAAALGGGGVATVEIAATHPAHHRPAQRVSARPAVVPAWRPVASTRVHQVRPASTDRPRPAEGSRPRKPRSAPRAPAPGAAARTAPAPAPAIRPAATAPTAPVEPAASAHSQAPSRPRPAAGGSTGEFGP